MVLARRGAVFRCGHGGWAEAAQQAAYIGHFAGLVVRKFGQPRADGRQNLFAAEVEFLGEIAPPLAPLLIEIRDHGRGPLLQIRTPRENFGGQLIRAVESCCGVQQFFHWCVIGQLEPVPDFAVAVQIFRQRCRRMMQ
jgi:hypothetical protein